MARALVHNSPVIIFDKATSNTDVYSEHQINGSLQNKDTGIVTVIRVMYSSRDVDNRLNNYTAM